MPYAFIKIGMGTVKREKKTDFSQKMPAAKPRGSWKRIITICLGVIGLAVLGWLGFMLFGNNYKSNAMQMKVNTVVASRLAYVMLNDYQENWVRVETEQLGLNEKGVVVSTDDAGQVLKWRQDFFKNNNTTQVLEQLMSNVDENMNKMSLTPARYRDTKDNFKAAIEHLQALAQLTRTPGDSLVGMATEMSRLLTSISQDLEATDFNFWVTYDDIQARIEELAPQLQEKSVVEAIKKEVPTQLSSVVNSLKYKKMGFKELPKGKGVLYHELTKGKGPKPKDDTRVRMHYEGKLMDGTVFDSSYQRGEPVTMRPSQTVPGFWHSMVQMPVGSKWEVYIPYDQAYGARAAGAVKPYSDLFFTLEVLGIDNAAGNNE